MVKPAPLRAWPPLDHDAFAGVRRRTIFECCKWDPQVEDVSVLASFPLIIDQHTWRELVDLAQALAAETLAAERELVGRPDLHQRLGLPRSIRNALRRAQPGEDIARVMRFDFHPTPDGWRITEVNSDVPGGFIEASGFTALLAEHYPHAQVAGNPAAELGRCLAERLHPGALVGLVHATAYTDDRQVMTYLSQRCAEFGLRTCLLAPDQIDWHAGVAHIATDWCRGRADALVRFFPGEWLPNLPRRSRWPCFLSGARTPLCNPATALLTQSKRFPLVWDQLGTDLSTWRNLLPETRDPRQADWQGDDNWILKPALGRVGEAIGMRGVTRPKDWTSIARCVFWHPNDWAAQRRFEALSIETDQGEVYPSIGVFTIDGRAQGIYGRAAALPLINHLARDVAVLIEDDSAPREHEILEPRDEQPAAV